ncbi:hypothetical protein B7C51_25115 (plasmid) [Paenibacillus larvae subsp. pulvifaciens]|uniref:Uncharacterized protein n=1 Tax=Paenibacillus larvae subsp. pulvifaciens TaxID=1477 RepID=A0A1V0UZV6_9BACL|nr:hypothetical protein [Paenibacillus larvae]ARF70755.1 hypothetical protein B7C51_25115 [Paenibacillus larvae subsp. pulvifaciens]
MKFTKPNGEVINLDTDIPYDSKLEITNKILDEYNNYFTTYKNSVTKSCLRILSNYLCSEKGKSKAGEKSE